MSKIKKAVTIQMPSTVHLNVCDLPAHESDTLCRVLIHSVTEAFKNPKFAADYERWRERWREQRHGKQAVT